MPEQQLLRERIRVLHRYGNLTVAHGMIWPPPVSTATEGHLPFPEHGCGSFQSKTSSPEWSFDLLGMFGTDDGGWQGVTAAAHRRWGGEDSCTVRVLSAEEWENASPQCLAALFTRPFLVRNAAESVANRR